MFWKVEEVRYKIRTGKDLTLKSGKKIKIADKGGAIMDEYSDKRILADQTRQPRENEFIFHDRIVFGGEQLQEKIFEYIMVNSNV